MKINEPYTTTFKISMESLSNKRRKKEITKRLNEERETNVKKIKSWVDAFFELMSKYNFTCVEGRQRFNINEFKRTQELKSIYKKEIDYYFSDNNYKVEITASLNIIANYQCEVTYLSTQPDNFKINYKVTDEYDNTCENYWNFKVNTSENLLDSSYLIKVIEKLEKNKSEQQRLDEMVKKEKPTAKDLDRARGLNHSKSAASKIAKLITDQAKMVRRAKAVIEVYPDWNNCINSDKDVWTPFKRELKFLRFSQQNISDIENGTYK